MIRLINKVKHKNIIIIRVFPCQKKQYQNLIIALQDLINLNNKNVNYFDKLVEIRNSNYW